MRTLLTIFGLGLLLILPIAFAPSRPAAASHIAAVSAGGQHTCALTTAGGVKCWGRNHFGQLGNGQVNDLSVYRTPQDVIGISNATSLSAGAVHNCATIAGGGLKCWGSNSSGEAGDGTSGTEKTTPVEVIGLTGGAAAVSAGFLHTCAVNGVSGVQCWGLNHQGQLGNDTTASASLPVDVVGLSSGVSALASGFGFSCALLVSGGVKCWGDNGQGQLGNDTFADSLTPVAVAGLSSGVSSLVAGENHACARTTTGGIKCWGSNEAGQLGDGTTNNAGAPVDVAGLASGVASITSDNGLHTCAVLPGGDVQCWGYNGDAQLGIGSSTPFLESEPVDATVAPADSVAASAGGLHTCALTSSGGVLCWGGNDYGQLGGDIDRDGCTDAAEQAMNPMFGGRRDSVHFWDFFDVPTGMSLTRDKAISMGDIAQEVMRFGYVGDPSIDPLSTPSPTGYHPAYDRGGPAGPFAWNQAPANGSITIGDITAAVAQFGHYCS